MSTDLVAFLVSSSLSARFARRTVVIPAHSSLAYDASTWRGALVLLTRGRIHLVPRAGEGVCFEQGAVLSLQDLALRCIDNADREPVLLVALTRTRSDRRVHSAEGPAPHIGTAAGVGDT